MFYMTVKLKNVIIALVVLICTITLAFSGNEIKSVFSVGGREVPIYSVAREDSGISLTFNCAWNDSDIDEIISLLKEYDMPATFFIVGDWAEKFPESVKKLYSAGFEIGNHSYNHAHYNKMSDSEILSDMEKCDRVLLNITGVKPILFRSAYGEYNDRVIKLCESSGRTYIQWSVDSLDYKASSAEEITERVLKKVSPGDIILMHNGTEHTKDALKILLPALKEKFAPLKVSDLIYKDDFYIDPSGKQHKN